MMEAPRVIYLNKNFIFVSKPAGFLVHRVLGKTADVSILTDWLEKKYPEILQVGDDPKLRPGVVHRLDKDTSGLMVVARKQESFSYLKKLFKEHKVKKIYSALVYGKTAKHGSINTPMGIKSGTIKRTIYSDKLSKPAYTEYRALKYYLHKEKGKEQFFSFLEVIPKTGRTHQIRVHLSSIQHPIVGDELYGKKGNSLELGRQFLHSKSIEFSKADGERIKVEVDLPKDLSSTLAKLHEI